MRYCLTSLIWSYCYKLAADVICIRVCSIVISQPHCYSIVNLLRGRDHPVTMWHQACVYCTGYRYNRASNINCAPRCTLFIMDCARCTSSTQSSQSPSTRRDLVCVLPTARRRRTGYRDVVRPWASVHSLTPARSHETLRLQHFVT